MLFWFLKMKTVFVLEIAVQSIAAMTKTFRDNVSMHHLFYTTPFGNELDMIFGLEVIDMI